MVLAIVQTALAEAAQRGIHGNARVRWFAGKSHVAVFLTITSTEGDSLAQDTARTRHDVCQALRAAGLDAEDHHVIIRVLAPAVAAQEAA